MKSGLNEEVKLMNLVRFLEIYKGEKWAVNDLLSEKDKLFIKSKTLENLNSDLLSEALRNGARIKVLNVNNKENIIRYTPKELEILRLEILKNIFKINIETTQDYLTREVAIGNIIDVLAIQSKNGFFRLSEEQLDYLNSQIKDYKEDLDERRRVK